MVIGPVFFNTPGPFPEGLNLEPLVSQYRLVQSSQEHLRRYKLRDDSQPQC
jgi:hypothetical protein